MLKGLAAAAGLAACGRRAPSTSPAAEPPMPSPSRMPVLFVGHGSPMHAITDNEWSRAFRALGEELPRPEAVLAISAHWYVDGTLLTGLAQPRTIHDFGGFPRALHEVQYPARADLGIARRARALIGEERARLDEAWGYDHGTWSVLKWMYPEADVPVVQLSLDRRLASAESLALARALRPLRADGVLVLGSGNLTHNLRDAMTRMRSGQDETPDWAERFDRDVAAMLTQGDHDRLARAVETEDGRRSHPTPDHWLPLVYAAGAAEPDEPVTFPITGFDAGSLSMRAVRFG